MQVGEIYNFWGNMGNAICIMGMDAPEPKQNGDDTDEEKEL